MKLRIYRSIDGYFYIQKRIFKFLFIEWWKKYNRGLCQFSSGGEARERIKEIEQQELERRHNKKKGQEILRYTI